ncbi:MAG: glycine--tRNA ligase subunit beta, partial [Acidocella sp.]|nr:glycine--tRNA ligase subunit beta [Acidocella sp.]
LDGGVSIIEGNQRVLRARLSDAQYFWARDRETPLDDALPKLDTIIFHAKIGTQRARADRIAKLAAEIAKMLGANDDEQIQARWAGLLCKADLVTGMVGEFPELQGIMGGYYAAHNPRGWDGSVVGPAIRSHYQPRGPGDAVPVGLVAASVALADKLDTLIQFFKIGETPTGSGDPFALRRAALGVIRIILEARLPACDLVALTAEAPDLYPFILERLRVKLKNEGQRFDVLDATLRFAGRGNLVSLIEISAAVGAMLATDYGARLLNAYRRAANILRIEEAKDGCAYDGPVSDALLITPEDKNLAAAISAQYGKTPTAALADYSSVLQGLARLDGPVNAFFQTVSVNDADPAIRQNRLRLLAQLRDIMHQIADFSKIEG